MPAATETPCVGKAELDRSSRAPTECQPCSRSEPLGQGYTPKRSPVGTGQFERPTKAASQLLLQPSRGHVPTTRQCPNDHLITRMQTVQHRPGHMSQTPSHAMSFHCRTHPLGNDQPDTRSLAVFVLIRPADVNDDIGLHHAHSVLHCRVKVRRTPHTVACRKHRWGTRRCDQAVKARRPLPRRLDTMARPARVRIRKRKP